MPHDLTLKPSESTQGLLLKERLIFERSSPGRTGFELPPLTVPKCTPQRYLRRTPASLPEVSELDVVRHFTRLSSWNYAIDLGPFPLGSCTMKYNPRINEEIAALAGFSEVHPDLPEELCQGAYELIYRLEQALCAISGMDACSTQPAAGAQGEFTGLLCIKAFHESLGSHRKYVLIPDTAHGTNPASCTLAGYETITLKSDTHGVLGVEPVREALNKYGREIAALMLTNPNTLGLFESNIVEISELVHGIGGQVYMDGANMNAIMGIVKPKDMGVDVMQYNLHKTFSTPHGGGGPGAGPVAVRSHLAPFLPNPRIVLTQGKYRATELPTSVGKMRSHFGNFGVLVRAYTYICHHGANGLKRISRTAVLNANYIRQRLLSYYVPAVQKTCFHECLFTDQKQLKDSGVKTLQIAKALIDEGFHPPTIYFPLVVSGAMLIEPTETESLEELDQLVSAFIRIAEKAAKGEKFDNAPTQSIVGKVDEVGAARKPILTLDDRLQ